MTKGINESVEQASAKYNIIATFEIQGVVEVQDVVGALFGQTEGLFNDLDLRALQKSGRVGRIVVNAESTNGITRGEVIIPSSLDRTETAILAATLETVDRVGPCRASLTLNEIRDLRESKLRQIEARAKELLKDWKAEASDKANISEKITSALERESIITWQGLPAGSDIDKAERVIIVEGRNDIQQLLKIGVKNTIAVNGTSVPKSIIDLTYQKECIAFLDGDRGGDMILNELMQVSKIKYYARAPLNREVEELSPKELVKCLQQKRPIEQLYKERRVKEDKTRRERENRNFNSKPPNNGKFYESPPQHGKSRDFRSKERKPSRSRSPNPRDNRFRGTTSDKKYPRSSSRQRGRNNLQNLPVNKLEPLIREIVSSNQAIALDNDYNIISRTTNISIFNEMNETYKTIIIDGVVNQRFLDHAVDNKIQRIIAVNIKPRLKIEDPNAIA